jgi:hypothetical protein
MQLASEQIPSIPSAEPDLDVEMAPAADAAAAPLDKSMTGGTKRKAEGTRLAEDNKKAKTGMYKLFFDISQQPVDRSRLQRTKPYATEKVSSFL